MIDFTDDEVTLLLEGLDSIEKAQAIGDSMEMLVGGMMSTMGTPVDDEATRESKRKQYFAEHEVQRQKKLASRRRKIEDVYLIRAKLVQLRRVLDGQVADRILSESRG